MRHLGIDVGGTNTKAVLLEGDCSVIASSEVPTGADGSLETVLAAVRAAVEGMEGWCTGVSPAPAASTGASSSTALQPRSCAWRAMPGLG